MTVREIQGHLAELYGTEVLPDLISRVTDAVLDEVRDWQNQLLSRGVFLRPAGQDPRRRGWSKTSQLYAALALTLRSPLRSRTCTRRKTVTRQMGFKSSRWVGRISISAAP